MAESAMRSVRTVNQAGSSSARPRSPRSSSTPSYRRLASSVRPHLSRVGETTNSRRAAWADREGG